MCMKTYKHIYYDPQSQQYAFLILLVMNTQTHSQMPLGVGRHYPS